MLLLICYVLFNLNYNLLESSINLLCEANVKNP